MSKLLRKLRQIEYYPRSGDILSVLVDQISFEVKEESVGFILVSAFEEIVKLIDVSCGTHVEYYVPTVLTLSTILPMTSSSPGVSKIKRKGTIESFEKLIERRKNQEDDRMEESEEQIENDRNGI